MKTFLRLTMVFTIILFACNVWAQNRPQCPVDGNGMPIMEDVQGACFMDVSKPNVLTMWDDDKTLIVFLTEAGKEFLRFTSQDKRFGHGQVRDGVFALLCPGSPETCANMPVDATWLMGTGTFTINSQNLDENLFLTCPTILRFKGELADDFGRGIPMNVHGLLTRVKDPDSEDGCRFSLLKVDVD